MMMRKLITTLVLLVLAAAVPSAALAQDIVSPARISGDGYWRTAEDALSDVQTDMGVCLDDPNLLWAVDSVKDVDVVRHGNTILCGGVDACLSLGHEVSRARAFLEDTVRRANGLSDDTVNALRSTAARNNLARARGTCAPAGPTLAERLEALEKKHAKDIAALEKEHDDEIAAMLARLDEQEAERTADFARIAALESGSRLKAGFMGLGLLLGAIAAAALAYMATRQYQKAQAENRVRELQDELEVRDDLEGRLRQNLTDAERDRAEQQDYIQRLRGEQNDLIDGQRALQDELEVARRRIAALEADPGDHSDI